MERVGPYALGEQLGAGGMGVVYRARRDGAEHDVALKMVGGAGTSPEALARFARETRIAAELDHPGIVRVLEAGEEGDSAWFAMELVEGPALDGVIREGDVSARRAVEIVQAVADAVSAAHDRGVLHRDLKPSNVLLGADGVPRVTDFGLAKDTGTESKHTRTGQTLGTPAYMSPEQARGDLAELTPATDVWSLGCVLYELAAGRPAFTGDTPAGIIGNVLSGTTPRLTDARSDDDRGINRLLAGCLAPDPLHRYPTAGALAQACRALLRGETPPLPADAPRSRRARPAAAVAALALAGAAAVWWWWPATEPPPVEPDTRPFERAASHAWDQRRIDPAAGAAQLAALMGDAAAGGEWSLRLGLLQWAAGDVESARTTWEAIPAASEHRPGADWYLGLESLTQMPETGRAESFTRARRYLERARARRGPHARLAAAGLALLRTDHDAVIAELRDVPGWEAALLRALADHWPHRHPMRALRDYEVALDQGLQFDWIHFNRAVLLRDQGDYRPALEIFDRLVEKTPDDLRTRRSRAATRLLAGDLAGALNDFDAVVAARPEDLPVRSERADLRSRLPDPERQLARLDAAVQAAPGDPAAWAERGRWHWFRGAAPEALRDLSAALKLTEDRSLRIWRANARIAAGDKRGAAEDVARVLATHPDDDSIRIQLARLLKDAGELHQALAVFTEALERRPWAHAARLDRGVVYLDLGRIAESVADLEQIPAGSREYPFARSTLGLVAYEAGDLERAAREYEAALEADVHCAPAFHNRGLLRRRRGDLHGALEDQDAALAAAPELEEARRERATLREHLGDLSGARADYDHLLRSDPADTALRFARGIVLERLGDPKAAFDDYIRIVKADPDHAGAWTNLGVIRAGAQQWRLAVESFSNAVRVNPALAVAWYSRGVAHRELGHLEAAERDFREALRRDPDLPDAHGALGMLLAGQERWGDAVAPLQRALELAPDSPMAQHVRARLAACRAKLGGGK